MRLRVPIFLLFALLIGGGCEQTGLDDFGTASPFELSPSVADFGQVRLGQTATLWLRIRNRTDSVLVLAPAIIGNDRPAFRLLRQPDRALLPGALDSLLLSFTPSEARLYQAKLLLGDDHPVEVPLRGIGVIEGRLQLIAAIAETPPTIDGVPDDPVWRVASPLSLTLHQVEPNSPDTRTITASIRAASDDEFLYLLVEVEDPTPHQTPNLFRFRGGDPASEANWSLSTEGQDGIGLIFPISMPGDIEGDQANQTFETVGCAVTCHSARSVTIYEGGSYPTTGRIDIWYWKAGTTNPQGYADDYVAEGRNGSNFPEERRGDAGNRFEEPNFPPHGAGPVLPVNMAGGDNGGLDPRLFLWYLTAVPFNPRARNPATGRPWTAGDVVPGWLLRTQSSPFASRGDIIARGRHANGRWSVEFRRRLNTGKSDDALFARGRSLPFSLAYFDNSRKYAPFEYAALPAPPRPDHFGPIPPVIWLLIP